MKLGQERRGVYKGMHYLDTARVEFDFEFPLGEIVLDFFDKLKSLVAGLRVARLRDAGLPRVGSRQARHADQRRPDRRLQRDHPPGQGVGVGPEDRREAQGADPAAAVRGGDPGGDRQQGHRPRDDLGVPEGRARQVLRRRHHAEAQAPREAEGREEAHEADRRRRDPAGGVSGGAAGGLMGGRAGGQASGTAGGGVGHARHPDGVPRRRGAHDAVARGAGRAAWAGGRGDDAGGGGAARDPSGGRHGDPLRQARRRSRAPRPLAAGAAAPGAALFAGVSSAPLVALGRAGAARGRGGADRLRRQPGGGDVHPAGPSADERPRGGAAAGPGADGCGRRPAAGPGRPPCPHRRRPRGRRRLAPRAQRRRGVRGAGAGIDLGHQAMARICRARGRARRAGRGARWAGRRGAGGPGGRRGARPRLQRGGRARAPGIRGADREGRRCW